MKKQKLIYVSLANDPVDPDSGGATFPPKQK